MTSASSASHTASHPLQRTDFRALVLGATAASLSIGFFEVPVMWWLAQRGGAQAVAAVALVGSLAYIVAAPLGGILTDRLPKVRLAQGGYVLDAVLTAVAAALLLHGLFPLAAVLVLLALTNLITAAREPALGALVPLLLAEERVGQGNAAMGLATTVAAFASFGVAGALTAVVGPAGTLLVGSGLLLSASLALAWVREPAVASGGRGTEAPEEGDATAGASTAVPEESGRAWTAGFRALLESPLLGSITLTAAVLNFVLAPAPVLFAPYAADLGNGAAGYGALGAAILGGQLLGLLLRNATTFGRPLPTLVSGTVGLGAGIALLAVAPGLIAALVCAASVGAAASVLNVELQTLFQTRVDPERLGRALGVFTAASRAAQPAGLAIAGALAGVAAPREIFLVIGLATLASTLLWLRPTVARHLGVVASAPPEAA